MGSRVLMGRVCFVIFLLMGVSCSKVIADSCLPPNGEKLTLISEIQSEVTSLENDVSPLKGKVVWVEAVVSLSKQGKALSSNKYDKQYRGYWLQEQVKDYDQNAQTSEGIFVFDVTNKVKLGDQILIKGEVGEYKQVTQLQAIKKVIRCSNNQITEPIALNLPVGNLLDMEALEGMLIETNSLVVSDFYGVGFGLQRYGQMVLSSKLQFAPTEIKSLELFEYQKMIERYKHDRITLDDGSSTLNPSFLPYPNGGGLGMSNPIKIGQKVRSVVGVKHGFKSQNLIIPKLPVTFEPFEAQNINHVANMEGVKIASLNMRNYFNGETQFKHFPAARGAKTKEAFKTQHLKLVSALLKTDADIIALVEMENDGFNASSAIVELLSALNKNQSDQQKYTYIKTDASDLNTDEITQVFLYRKSKVSQIGHAQWIDLNHKRNPFKVRPALFVSFEIEGERLSFVLSHFKSRRGKCIEHKATSIVEGNCYSVRMRSAQKITSYLKQSDEAVILLGDLNAYSHEGAMKWFYKNGFENGKWQSFYGQGVPYTYSYNGLLGNLDHVLLNSQAKSMVAQILDWHINSESPELFSQIIDKRLGKNSYLRSSDHDLTLIVLSDI